MIDLAKNHSIPAGEICLRCEPSHATKTEATAQRTGNGSGAKIIHLTQENPPDRARLKAARRIEISLRHMMQNLNQALTVPALSAMAGLSESSFFALFKMATGQTPLDFFIRARMHRAGELLAETTLQIKQVAAVLGYDDQFYFSRRFKSVHGLSPREYRARNEASNPQNLQCKGANGQTLTGYFPPHLSHLVRAGENQESERVLIGRFTPSMPRPKAFRAGGRDASSRPDQTCSVSFPR